MPKPEDQATQAAWYCALTRMLVLAGSSWNPIYLGTNNQFRGGSSATRAGSCRRPAAPNSSAGQSMRILWLAEQVRRRLCPRDEHTCAIALCIAVLSLLAFPPTAGAQPPPSIAAIIEFNTVCSNSV